MYESKGAEAIQRIARSDWLPKGNAKVHTSVSLSIKSKSRLKYRCIATSKVRNEKDKKLEKTHCEVMLFSFEGMTSKEKIR